MASFVKFEAFSENLAKGVFNLHTDTLNIYLSNTAPSASGDAVKADLAEISTGNGYAGAVDTQNSVSRSGGTTSVLGTDVTITANSGDVGPFQYVVLFDDTAANDELIGYWDYGSAITLHDTDQFITDFGSSMFTVA